MNKEQEPRLHALRARIGDIEAPTSSRPPLSLGAKAIDGLLGGGLVFGRVHAVRGRASLGFLTAASARCRGPVLWCCLAEAMEQPYMEGARQIGLDPDRVILAECEHQASLLGCAETSLASGAASMVVAQLEAHCDRLVGRRLQLAAERGDSLGLIAVAGRGSIGWAETGWDVQPAPSESSRPAWALGLVRSRRSATRSWRVEWDAHEICMRLA